jgi:GNAT superfamily N-acetyltransferase
VIRALPGGYELDDDVDRIDVDMIHGFVTEQYWARGRGREVVEDLVRASARVIGVFLGDRQVGFCRVVSDGHVMAYLSDVFILPEHRGYGLGKELASEAIDRGPHAGLIWLLHTKDAHGFYDQFGFSSPGERLLERWPANK